MGFIHTTKDKRSEEKFRQTTLPDYGFIAYSSLKRQSKLDEFPLEWDKDGDSK
jgi:hypothetical protein